MSTPRLRFGPEVTSSIVVGPSLPSGGKLDVDVEIVGFDASKYPAIVDWRATPHDPATHYPLEIVQFIALPSDVSRPDSPSDLVSHADAVVHVSPSIDPSGAPVRVSLPDLIPGLAVRIYTVLFDTID